MHTYINQQSSTPPILITLSRNGPTGINHPPAAPSQLEAQLLLLLPPSCCCLSCAATRMCCTSAAPARAPMKRSWSHPSSISQASCGYL
jgi:hypothetical protein